MPICCCYHGVERGPMQCRKRWGNLPAGPHLPAASASRSPPLPAASASRPLPLPAAGPPPRRRPLHSRHPHPARALPAAGAPRRRPASSIRLPAAPPPSPPPVLPVNHARAPHRRRSPPPARHLLQPPGRRRRLPVGALLALPAPAPCSVRLPATSPQPPRRRRRLPAGALSLPLRPLLMMMVTGSDADNVAGACAANAGQSNKDKGKGTMTAGRSTMTDTNVEVVCKNDNPIMDWFCNSRNESAPILDEFIESDLETANPSTFIAQELEMDETEVAAFKKDTLQKRGKKRRLGFVEEDVEVEDVESDSVQGSQEYAEFDSNDSEGDGQAMALRPMAAISQCHAAAGGVDLEAGDGEAGEMMR
ncbi:hypothetical protein GUJ93_ZPchr0004g39034 [Zizania palustris]|uniref:Uncharacterized protein n=1 Tax=Zizania palustris TaxID=103762 RepID=A0A8J5SDE8_ZIZPA|nr:hypothetical protein GUJ93_ZPchr0004g39034 [Zizania palustris]